MTKQYFVVENVRHWRKKVPQVEFLSVNEYLFSKDFQDAKRLRIINLARNYGYLGAGYYVSLVAEARGHQVIPSLSTVQALSRKEFYLIETDDLDVQVQKSLANITDDKFELSVYFGRNVNKKYEKLSRLFFNLLPCPLFRVHFVKEKHWTLGSIKPVALDKIPAYHEDIFMEALLDFGVRRWSLRKRANTLRYDLAILYNPQERYSPSSEATLQKFIKAGKTAGLAVEVIEKRDYAHLPEFDGLFIRETTAIDHHTFRFARKAQKENMVVIDDPRSILYCTNKIFLNEVFKRGGVPRPRTLVLSEDNMESSLQEFSFPIILKIPDGSFSRGVVKAHDTAELKAHSKEFFRHSDYIIAQEFMPTEFDWRIGVFNGKPLFACQYFMSRNHWQIINHKAEGSGRLGEHKTHPIESLDEGIVSTALKSCKLIGDGLYGVDLKMVGGKPYVVEVNDNPNIDTGVEDELLKDKLYQIIMEEFAVRIDKLRMRKESPVLQDGIKPFNHKAYG